MDLALQIEKDFARKLYENMLMLPSLDNLLYNVQRQGKISFYVSPKFATPAGVPLSISSSN